MNNWESWDIRGHTLEYDDESHTYLCDGLIVPSVTEIMEKKRFSRKYQYVPKNVLMEAARKGTLLHHTIEKAEKSGFFDKYDLLPEEQEIAEEFASYFVLKKENGLICEGNELPLLIPYKGKIIAAGRMDILAVNGNGEIGVVDIKRTANLDEKYLSYQLTLYGRGLQYCYNIKPAFYGCLWLRESKRKYKLIEPCENLVEELLEEVANEV